MINKAKGQTLIETLVTLVFISMAVIALIRFQNYLAYDTSVSQQTGDAVTLAQSTMETLRDFQVLNNTGGYTSYQGIVSGSSVSTGVSAVYTVTWTVTTTASPSYKDLVVTVTWTDRRGTAQSVTLDSRLAGIQPSNSATVM